MKLTFEEAMHKQLTAYYDRQPNSYFKPDLVDADLKTIVKWLIKKWVKETK